MLEVGQDEGDSGKVGDSSRAHRDVAQGLPAFDERGEAAFSEAAKSSKRYPMTLWSRCGQSAQSATDPLR